ncbi:MAG: hypothetical protein LBV34_19995, partial [Nocardiopsaceae bacterium]|nr:hypothetical protein [Nocardiopsaceae bacterium]
LAVAAPATSAPGSGGDLDEISGIAAASSEVVEAPDSATAPGAPTVSDKPPWMKEPSTEHGAWPGAVPLVSGPLPATTTGKAGSDSEHAGPGAFDAGASASEFGAFDSPPSGPQQPDLPTRRPGKTGLAWGENALPGGRWASFPLTGTSAGAPGSDIAEAAPMRTDAWAPAPSGTAAPRGDTGSTGITKPRGASRGAASPTGAVPPSADEAGASQQTATTKAEQVDAGAASAELDGLPVRVRQANLAPQLRKPGPPAPEPGLDEPAAPSPEAARSTMAAIQLGWQRGRSVAGPAEPAGDAVATGTADVAPPAGTGEPARQSKSAAEKNPHGVTEQEPAGDTKPPPSKAKPVSKAKPASKTEPAGDTKPASKTEPVSRIRPDGNSKSDGGTKPASGGSRTTPSPKPGDDQENKGEAE